MRLQVWSQERNFGDQLNLWMWPRLIPGFFDVSDEIAFFGIGTVLHGRRIVPGRKVVFGSGVGYGSPPAIDPKVWKIYAVRGPESARLLGLDPCDGILDAAALLRLLDIPPVAKRHSVAFMPHIGTAVAGYVSEACALAGYHYIDPRGDPPSVIEDIQSSEMVLCQAMHGAIVADIMRIPWLPIGPAMPAGRAKWHDWGASIGVEIHHVTLYDAAFQTLVDKLVHVGNWAYDANRPLLRIKKKYLHYRQKVLNTAQDPETESGRSTTISWIGPATPLRPFPGYLSEMPKFARFARRERDIREAFEQSEGERVPEILAERMRDVVRGHTPAMSTDRALENAATRLFERFDKMLREMF